MRHISTTTAPHSSLTWTSKGKNLQENLLLRVPLRLFVWASVWERERDEKETRERENNMVLPIFRLKPTSGPDCSWACKWSDIRVPHKHRPFWLLVWRWEDVACRGLPSQGWNVHPCFIGWFWIKREREREREGGEREREREKEGERERV